MLFLPFRTKDELVSSDDGTIGQYSLELVMTEQFGRKDLTFCKTYRSEQLEVA